MYFLVFSLSHRESATLKRTNLLGKIVRYFPHSKSKVKVKEVESSFSPQASAGKM